MIDQKLADELKKRATEGDAAVLRSAEFRSLFDAIKTLPAEERSAYGQAVNGLRQEIEAILADKQDEAETLPPIDVTAPFDVNVEPADQPKLLPAEQGSIHPLMSELKTVIDIFGRMGFTALESLEIDDDYHMFSSLNFPDDHPARDDYDTFMTKQTDKNGNALIAPAHVSTMQNRLQKMHSGKLEEGKPIAVVYTGRTFRNEDVDARHEHTFYQVEISYVDKNINAGNLVATFKAFLEEYYGQKLDIKTQPFYFPFTEPSFEMALSCPFCQKAGCSICSQTGWIELLGCGMINPNVLRHGGIDPEVYTGFAGGMGLDRLVMMKYAIEDVRLFESGRLDFLRQFR